MKGKLKKDSDKYLIEYVKSQQWGQFKNTKRSLLVLSAYIHGVRNKMKKYANISANENIYANDVNGLTLKIFNLDQPQLEKDFLEKNLKPEKLTGFIESDRIILNKIRKNISLIESAIENDKAEKVKKFAIKYIELYAEMCCHEYIISGLLRELHLKRYKSAKDVKALRVASRWKNDDYRDKVSGVLKIILGCFLNNEEKVLPKNVVEYLHINEFLDFLNGKISIKKILEIVEFRRKSSFILFDLRNSEYQNMVLDYRDKHELKKIKEHIWAVYEYILNKKTKRKKLKGKSVLKNKGVIIGECVLIKQEEDLSGDINLKDKILVTTISTPKYVAYVRGVKGIITDNGGIICHAATLAREFDVPCIIGTEAATRILKSGDSVEMDTKTGEIKKITIKKIRLARSEL